MNDSNIYERKLYKEEFKKLYNDKEYDFPINDNLLSNLITKWKLYSIKFKNTSVLDNLYDYKNNLILREFRNLFVPVIKII